jgi:glycosyltransferase involved in cell wall biosynthesis
LIRNQRKSIQRLKIKIMTKALKLLTIGHSYVVALNRRLANEMAKQGGNRWQVTAIAPTQMQGDLRSVQIEADPEALYNLEVIPNYFSRYIHVMMYDWKLRELLHQDWDVIHCWEEPYILSGWQIAHCKPKHTPLVYSTFQNYQKNYPFPFNWIENDSMSKAVGWIGFGQTGIDALKDRQGYDKPWRKIPAGIDTEHFYPNPDARKRTLEKLNWTDDGIPVVGFLGRFVPEKGIELLMDTLRKITCPWRALFVGAGPMEAQIQTWAAQYPERVRICTDVRHAQVPDYLNTMDLLCAPSQSLPNWREQFGRMLIEAMACGVPVIGSDSGEIPHVLADAGRVVPEKDTLAWQQAISQLLANPEEREQLSAQGLDKVAHSYTWKTIAQEHLSFFEELL